MLCSANPQEVMDLGAVAHLTAIAGRFLFLHFFDGFQCPTRSSQRWIVWDYDELKSMVDMDALNAFPGPGSEPGSPGAAWFGPESGHFLPGQ